MVMGAFTRNSQDGRLSAREAAFECTARVHDTRPSDSLEWIDATKYFKLQIQCSNFFKACEGAVPVPHPDANLGLHTKVCQSPKESDVTRI
ncbi:hypothetical protein N7499_003126 [Penicillium canescens]|uniref:Uncharacterized protein n=1 Tax=Penicillium canescens TaxID=5083 RepID=A0AAD6N8U7_PENCN|nr:uncharacterized protein N7446_011998 [Penicillium canescens]KAJ6019779.1 hypothetical protein N7522_000487 [Penicillium canescens]KAJ6039067.1 hypothetical protein N7460_007099 [Penicillium canescens]KAJ6047164.1 hypothetical protein N7446_011998 [Penicillium canescens]KAJ6059912.1 hypothetical protein N7444_003551 [Penicillium canescens]KAJ6093795.1 hypothetical protein N7499_003126 [Penicillium canescens]